MILIEALSDIQAKIIYDQCDPDRKKKVWYSVPGNKVEEMTIDPDTILPLETTATTEKIEPGKQYYCDCVFLNYFKQIPPVPVMCIWNVQPI